MPIISCDVSNHKVYSISLRYDNGIIEKVLVTNDGLYSVCYNNGTRIVTQSGRIFGVVQTKSDRDSYILFDTSEDNLNRKERIYFDQIKSIKDITPIDAYKIAIKHGFKGTVEEWLEFLKGEKGDAPIRGVDYWTEDDVNKIYENVDRDIKQAVGEHYDYLVSAAAEAKADAASANDSKNAAKEYRDAAEEFKNEIEGYKDSIAETATHADSVKSEIDTLKESVDNSATAVAEAEARIEGYASSANVNKDAAEAAKVAAENAQAAATSAKVAAENARSAAEGSAYDANQSKLSAEGYKNNAEDAATAAEEHKNSAKEYMDQVAVSKAAVDTAKDIVLTAKDDTLAAKTAAENAKNTANTAADNAKTSETAATNAKDATIIAQGKAETAQSAAESAKDVAITAKDKAEIAKTEAETAKTAAVTAQGKAEEAKTAADAAKSEAVASAAAAKASETNADLARADAADAKEKAEAAKVAAVNAKDAAIIAQGKAETAKTKAKTSETNAKSSETAAGIARTEAETAKAAAVIAQGKAEQAQQSAESAKDAAETARDSVNGVLADVQKAGEDTIAHINEIKDTLKGEKGDSGVYVGSGDMPEGYNVQIDPTGDDYADPSILYKKVWYCCGDSFSEGDYTNAPDGSQYTFEDGPYAGLKKVYSRFIAMRNNMKLNLLAKCGATVGLRKDDTQYGNTSFDPLTDTPSNTNNFFYNQLPKIGQDADYITLWFGINDSSKCDLGTISDETVQTFYGALNWSMLYLITNFPMAHIGLIVTNRCNSTYKQAIREVAQKWAVPYLDMEGDIKVPAISGTRENQTITVDPRVVQLRWNYFRVSDTNGHPNEKAHEYQSTFIENFLKSL